MHHNNTLDTSNNSQIQDLSTDTIINNANNSAFNTEICNQSISGIFQNYKKNIECMKLHFKLFIRFRKGK